MRQTTYYIIFILLTLAAGKSLAQQSGVFLPELNDPDNRLSTINNLPSNDRPKPKLKRISPLSIPQIQSSTNNFAPDFPNIDVSFYYRADQDETSIAINPTDPNNIIIGANDYRSDSSLFHFESFDGGLSWHAGSLLTGWPFAANPTDPAVAFNVAGKAFYSYGRTEEFPEPINDVICNVSTNGGKDWNLPVRVILDSTGVNLASTFADKYYIATDNSIGSPFLGRVYVAWVEYDLNKNARIRLSYSTDDGTTWSQAAYLTTPGNYQSPVPCIGTEGQVYVAYENIDPAQHEVRFASSTDGGKTFPVNKAISGYTDLGPLYSATGSAPHPVIKGYLRVNSFPSIDVDHSTLHHGRIYMTWAAITAGRQHILLSASDDGGNSWSSPKAAENDPSPVKTDKFFPWIAVDDSNGDIGIAYYDSRSDTSNVLTDLYMIFSPDGGQNFTPERISSASFDVRANSSIDTLPNGNPSYFFGDYNAIAVHNKTWYPAWTDSRIGYDQDIYTAIVLPHAPSAPRNFAATEDSITHLPDLTWEDTALTTFGAQLGDYVLRLKRLDGGLQVDLPKTTRSYKDVIAVKNTNYTYSLQAITPDQDTSVTQIANFSPRANNEPQPPAIISAKAFINSLQIFFRVPDKNAVGSPLKNLNKIYYLVNGIVTDSFLVNDNSQGNILNYFFSNLQPDGYYRIQLVASTMRSDGDTTLSVLSLPKWLYSGAPLASYTENFDHSKNIFTPFAWDTTNANGALPGNYINDSLPNVPYQAGIDSWFLLPPVTMSNDAHTIEFSHIALVAPGDSATVEVSTNDGVDYFPIREYDRFSHPAEWSLTLHDSRPVYEQLPLKNLIGQDAIIRFRLRTHSSGGDGWFIDSIHFTNALSVSSFGGNSFRAGLSSNPLRVGEIAKLSLQSDRAAELTVNIYSMLGEKIETLLTGKPISPGNYDLEFSPKQAGCYFYELIARSASREVRKYGKYVVMP
jgi:hypothetical protein